MSQIVKTMQAVALAEYGQEPKLQVVQMDIPTPSLDEVLIRVKASPINPSDLIFLSGKNPSPRKLPTAPGFEGSGVVVSSGGGTEADALVGKNVSFRSKADKDGAWAEYVVTDANRCIPLNPGVSFTQGAMLQVNPLTAWALVDSAQKAGHKCAIQNAAASALGRMVVKYAAERQLTIINIVRKEKHIELLHSLGAVHILNSEAPDFEKKLKALASELHATVAFDAIAGDVPNMLLKIMPPHSEVWAYGGLSNEPINVDPMMLIYGQKTVRGFWGPPVFYQLSKMDFDTALDEVQNRLGTVFATTVHSTYPLSEFQKALDQYRSNMTTGKVMFVLDD